MENWHLRMAARIVGEGGVIACPTEAVFGLSCSPWDLDAVNSLLELKQRPPTKGLIIVAATVAQLHRLVDFTALDEVDAILDSWPGPVTWVLPARKTAPGWIRGEHEEIAVRVSAHPLLQELCRSCGPVVSSSANLANKKPARTAQAVRNYFRDRLDYILPGKLGTQSRPSEIVHARSGKILRAGSA